MNGVMDLQIHQARCRLEVGCKQPCQAVTTQIAVAGVVKSRLIDTSMPYIDWSFGAERAPPTSKSPLAVRFLHNEGSGRRRTFQFYAFTYTVKAAARDVIAS